MTPDTARQLIALNRAFYDRFAPGFAQSRQQLNPGIERALAWLGDGETLFDLGCGDARVARHLRTAGQPAFDTYLGVDLSAGLLAQFKDDGGQPAVRLEVADVTVPGWAAGLAAPASLDRAVAFAMLHHMPGDEARRMLLRGLVSLLRPGARVVVSVWQFLHLARFRRKIVPWSVVGLNDRDVDPGDVLLSWERDGAGYRYVHQFGLDALVALLTDAGLRVAGHYRSDGKTGDLGLYIQAIWP